VIDIDGFVREVLLVSLFPGFGTRSDKKSPKLIHDFMPSVGRVTSGEQVRGFKMPGTDIGLQIEATSGASRGYGY